MPKRRSGNSRSRAGKTGRKRSRWANRPRGRPRQWGDGKPTPEVELRRTLLSGGGDPAKTSTAVDLLETRRMITREHADAARRLEQMRLSLFGPFAVSAVDWSDVDSSDGRGSHTTVMQYEEFLARVSADYGAAVGSIKGCGGPTFRLTVDVVIYGYWPACLVEWTHESGRQLEMIQDGLDALVREFTAAKRQTVRRTK